MSGGVGAPAGRETAKGGCIAGCPAEGDEDVFEGAVIDGTVDRPVGGIVDEAVDGIGGSIAALSPAR